MDDSKIKDAKIIMNYKPSNELPILHVGLPKTGTTFLQNNFFNKISDIHYMTPHRLWDKSFNWVFSINKDFDNYSKTIANVSRTIALNKEEYQDYIKSSINYFSLLDKRLLVSSEGLCGRSFSPLKNNYDIALMLHKIFGQAKIIFTFRQQANYCESIYKQLIFKENRYGRYVQFEEMYGSEKSQNSMSLFGELDWHQIYNNYCEIFGSENVLALPYEYMTTDLKSYMLKIQNFIGTEVRLEDSFYTTRENISEHEYKYLLKHKWWKPFSKNTLSFSGLTVELRNEIMSQVEQSNIQLAKKIDIDLSIYNYFQ